MSTTTDAPQQAASGSTPPQTAETAIREVWPSVTAVPAAAALGKTLIRSIILAPLGWFLLLPIYFMKVLPFVAKRYTLTNRRIMIRRGLKPKPSVEVALGDFDEVRVVESTIDTFFPAATLDILSVWPVALQLP